MENNITAGTRDKKFDPTINILKVKDNIPTELLVNGYKYVIERDPRDD